MTQIATVERILDSTHAVIAVPRKSACGHDCEECAGCGVSGASVRATAENHVGAAGGDKVVVEGSTKKVLGIVGLVYMVPIVLFLLGYFAVGALFSSEAVRTTLAVLGFVLGLVLAVCYDRHLRKQGGLTYTIVRVF